MLAVHIIDGRTTQTDRGCTSHGGKYIGALLLGRRLVQEWHTQEHSPSLTASDHTAAVCAGDAGDMLGGVHSACHPAATTVVGVVHCMGLTASSGDVAAVLVPGMKQIPGVAK
jgi:hypothetical protein